MHSTKIKELRTSQGLSRKQLAELSGVHWRTIQEVEKGADNTNQVLTKLYKALGFDLKPIKQKMNKVKYIEAHLGKKLNIDQFDNVHSGYGLKRIKDEVWGQYCFVVRCGWNYYNVTEEFYNLIKSNRDEN